MRRFACVLMWCGLVFASLPNLDSRAENPASWSLSEGTNGEDVFWTSPTAVDTGFPRYATMFDITRVEAFVGSIGVDVTDQLDLTGGTAVADSLPITFVDDDLVDPTSGTSASVLIGVDANGFGQAEITNVVLGQIVIIFPVSITRIEVDADIDIEGLIPGDFNRDLKVDTLDLDVWESSYGTDTGADTNFDGFSDGLDFLEWQQYFGTDLSALSASAAAVPEPGTLALLLIGCLGIFQARRNR